MPDFWIRKKEIMNNAAIVCNLFLEAKIGKSPQKPEQKEFEKSCDYVNEKYFIYRSTDDLIEILKTEGILKPETIFF